MEKKTYLATELSELIGVPRTTINDWLTKYGSYIDSENRGKRKVYGDAAVAVLKEISALRSAGRGAFEIGEALEARYGVRPEVAAHAGDDRTVETPPASTTTTPPESAAASAAGAESASTLPAARESVNPAALATFEEQMLLWRRQLEEMRQERERSARRSTATLVLTLILLVVLSGAGLYFGTRLLLDKYREENRALQAQLVLVGDRMARDRQEGAKQISSLEALLAQSENERKAESARQKKELESALARMNRESGDRSQAEMLRLRDDFAAARKAFLEELIRLRPATAPEKNVAGQELKPTPAPTPVSVPAAAPATDDSSKQTNATQTGKDVAK